MKITRSNYKKDKYYQTVTSAVHNILKGQSFVAPVDVFMQMGYLTKEDYENWRFGRIPCLERVIKFNLSKINRVMRILQLHAEDRGLYPSRTVYKKWGKGKRILLRFSKSGAHRIEDFYSTHYVVKSRCKKDGDERAHPS